MEEEEEDPARRRRRTPPTTGGRRRPVRLRRRQRRRRPGGVRGIVRRANGANGENADAIHRESGRFGTDLDATKRKTGKLERGTTTTKKKEHPIVFIHGVGSCAYTFRQVSVLLQEKGYETFAPDVVGHGDSEKSNGFKYDEKSYVEAMEAYVEKVGNGKQVDLVAHGFIIPQYAILLARKRPDLFRRMVLMNTPLDGNHNLAPPLATYTQMFGRGKGKPFDAVSLNYMGNEFAIPGDDLKEYERAYVGSDAENARMAVEMTVTNADFKNLKKKVKDAYFQGGMPKTRIVWGVADKYLDQAPMFSWASDVRASEKALRKVGHMPQEDYRKSSRTPSMNFSRPI